MNPRPDIGDHPARILIVDDERHNRQLLEVILTPEGHLLMAAASGEEALAVVAQHPPDLILLDIMMPGMDGYQVAARLKGEVATKNIPIIMVTALDDRAARMRGLSAGAEEFITKPVDRAELCVRVRNLLRLRAYGDYLDKYSQMLEGEVASRTADLAERMKLTAVLSEQAALLDLAQDAIVVRDMNWTILFWNRGAELLYGWSRDEAVGHNATDLLKSEFPVSAQDIEATLLREGLWEGEATHTRHDGTRLTVASRWSLQRDTHGNPVRILAITNDITGRKHADAERRLLTERLSLATAVAQVGVWDWDLKTNALTWDATMFAIYGLAPVEAMPYADWSAAVHPDDLPALTATLEHVIGDKGQGIRDFRILMTDGSTKHVSLVARAIVDERAAVVRIIGVNMDVTERKAAEGALEESRQAQLRFKDEFLSHVSHELRSPLTAIKQFTSILLSGVAGDLNGEQREYQQIVLKNIGQLQSMIDDLLEITRLETGKLNIEPERVPVMPAVADSLDTFQVTAGAKGVTLSHDVPGDLAAVNADPTRLQQILIILLDNAIKFTPAGGAVTVRVRQQATDPQFLLFEVTDTGCGLSPELTECIFDRLHQIAADAPTSRKGLGLGLYICRELVTRQGGRIWATSEPTRGSTFSFTLPVFSLIDLLSPLLKDGSWPSTSTAMISVWAPGARGSKASHDEWSRQARSIIQSCLLPDLDVLMPTMSSSSDGEQLFVAAFADDTGASVLASRIRKQLERRMESAGRPISVSYSMLPVVRKDTGALMDNMVERMAARVEQAITSHINPEAVHYE